MAAVFYLPQPEFERIALGVADTGLRLSLLRDMLRLNELVVAHVAGESASQQTTLIGEALIDWCWSGPNTLDAPVRLIVEGGVAAASSRSLLYALGAAESLLSEASAGNAVYTLPNGVRLQFAQPGNAIAAAVGLASGNSLAGSPEHVVVFPQDIDTAATRLCTPAAISCLQNNHRLTILFAQDAGTQVISKPMRDQLTACGWQVRALDSSDSDSLVKTALREDRPSVLMYASRTEPREPLRCEAALFGGDLPEEKDEFRDILDCLDVRMSAANLPGLEFVEDEIEDSIRPLTLPENLTATAASALLHFAAEHESLVLLNGSDLADRSLCRFRLLYPKRYVAGSSTRELLAMAGGLAQSGMLPVVLTNEPLAGFGASNYRIIAISLSERSAIADARSPSGCAILEPCCEAELYAALRCAVEQTAESLCIRLCETEIIPTFTLPPDYYLSSGRGVVLREGKDAVLLAAGHEQLSRALRTADLLLEHNFSLCVVNMPWLNRVDLRWMRPLLSAFDSIHILEKTLPRDGLGGFLLRECAAHNLLERRRFQIHDGREAVSEEGEGAAIEIEIAAEILKSAGERRLSRDALLTARKLRGTGRHREPDDSVRRMIEEEMKKLNVI